MGGERFFSSTTWQWRKLWGLMGMSGIDSFELSSKSRCGIWRSSTSRPHPSGGRVSRAVASAQS
jgi:hypothetical protein